jgi:hypothetical protein
MEYESVDNTDCQVFEDMKVSLHTFTSHDAVPFKSITALVT